MHLEIERKFLLKTLPDKNPDDIIIIDQYYYRNKKGIWERARTYHSDKYGDKYIHTIKKSISKSVNIEDEKELTKSEYDDFVNICKSDTNSKFIVKNRYVYNESDVKWEVDVFNGYSLIIAEVEIPKKNYKLFIPNYIKDVLLLEVTGLKQFSNRNLSINLKRI